MKKLKKIRLSSCLFLIIFLLFIINIYTASATDEVKFGLRFEDITSETIKIRRAYFNLKKGTAEPVSISVSLQYERSIFEQVQLSDIAPHENLKNKTISTSFIRDDKSDTIRVSVGLENYNSETLPEGDIFTVDFKVLGGVTPSDDSISFNKDDSLGPNQASTKEPRLLIVATESGDILDSGSPVDPTNVLDKENNGSNSCFINLLCKP